MFDEPLKPGNLTYKFNEGEYIRLVGVAGASAVSNTVRARLRVLLLEEEDAKKIYGVGITDFATLPGGHQQERPVMLYAKVVDCVATTANVWTDNDIEIKAYEQIRLKMIGVKPATHSYKMRLKDHRTKVEFPDRDPYWIIKEQANMLPFGDDDDYQGPELLPLPIRNYIWTNTTMKIQILDDGTALSAGDVRIQLIGEYRQVR